MRKLPALIYKLISILPAIALAACGFVDSGGSQGVNVDPNNRIENENVPIVLDATVLVEAPESKTFTWMQIKGLPVQLSGANSARARFTTPVVEQRTVLVFTLSAADEFGASESENVTVTVNDAPTANAGLDQSGRPGAQITLNGGASADTDGSLTYAWQQISGVPVQSPAAFNATQPTFIIPSAPAGAALVFRLIVTDDNGATASDTVTITVLAPPPPPPPPPPP
ncbi:MAG: hypothetical protein H0V34_09380, partial [Gammaproteobacteria bacterium]|nr:hypothetical protein [Gammaproteobacteria bacterium]